MVVVDSYGCATYICRIIWLHMIVMVAEVAFSCAGELWLCRLLVVQIIKVAQENYGCKENLLLCKVGMVTQHA